MSEQLDMNGIIRLAELKVSKPEQYKQVIATLKDVTKVIMDSAMSCAKDIKKMIEEEEEKGE